MARRAAAPPVRTLYLRALLQKEAAFFESRGAAKAIWLLKSASDTLHFQDAVSEKVRSPCPRVTLASDAMHNFLKELHGNG